MINFLPPEAKSAVKREYMLRTISVWALLLTAVAAVITAFLLPTYVLLLRQVDALELDAVRTEGNSNKHLYQAARTALEKAQTLAEALAVIPAGPTAYEVLRAIQAVQTDSITLSGFSYEHNGTSVSAVTVRGTAATREALVEFSSALEREPLFARATVPVAALAKDRDLPFTLSVTLTSKAL